MALSFVMTPRNIPKIQRLRASMPARLAEQAFAFATDVMVDSQMHYVPLGSGGSGEHLRDTGMVEAPVIEANGTVIVRLSYGHGGQDGKAVAIHEHLSPASPHSWKVAEQLGHGVHFHRGGPKYLERPLMVAARKFPIEIGQAWTVGLRNV